MITNKTTARSFLDTIVSKGREDLTAIGERFASTPKENYNLRNAIRQTAEMERNRTHGAIDFALWMEVLTRDEYYAMQQEFYEFYAKLFFPEVCVTA